MPACFLAATPTVPWAFDGNMAAKKYETEILAQKIRVDYLQVPVLLRVNAGGNSAGSSARLASSVRRSIQDRTKSMASQWTTGV